MQKKGLVPSHNGTKQRNGESQNDKMSQYVQTEKRRTIKPIIDSYKFDNETWKFRTQSYELKTDVSFEAFSELPDSYSDERNVSLDLYYKDWNECWHRIIRVYKLFWLMKVSPNILLTQSLIGFLCLF